MDTNFDSLEKATEKGYISTVELGNILSAFFKTFCARRHVSKWLVTRISEYRPLASSPANKRKMNNPINFAKMCSDALLIGTEFQFIKHRKFEDYVKTVRSKQTEHKI
jgi:hypothetical protein